MTRFEEIAAALRGEFLGMAGERAAAMKRLLERLDAAPVDEQALGDLQLHFHNFVGSGTTYGFPGLTALGLEGERWCQERRGRALDDAERAALHALFARVEGVLAAGRDAPS